MIGHSWNKFNWFFPVVNVQMENLELLVKKSLLHAPLEGTIVLKVCNFSFQNLFYYLKSFTNFNQPFLNSGSECTVMKDGNYECLCPLGKTGKFCRDSISISDPLFTGKHSFMSLNLDTHIRFNTEVSIFLGPSANLARAYCSR